MHLHGGVCEERGGGAGLPGLDHAHQRGRTRDAQGKDVFNEFEKYCMGITSGRTVSDLH